MKENFKNIKLEPNMAILVETEEQVNFLMDEGYMTNILIDNKLPFWLKIKNGRSSCWMPYNGGSFSGSGEEYFKSRGCKTVHFSDFEEKKEELGELDKADKILKELANLSTYELGKIFGEGSMSMGYLISMYSLSDIVTAYEVYKTPLKVRDVVYCFNLNPNNKGLVLKISDNNECTVLMQDGNLCTFKKSALKKTGNSIDIQIILDQIKK